MVLGTRGRAAGLCRRHYSLPEVKRGHERHPRVTRAKIPHPNGMAAPLNTPDDIRSAAGPFKKRCRAVHS